MTAGWGRNGPSGLPDERFAQRDFATEDALTRKLRENKEAIAERQAQLASLKQEVGSRDRGVVVPRPGRSAEWRVGVEQPNPFKHSAHAQDRMGHAGSQRLSPTISEAMKNHPMARLSPSSDHQYPYPHNQQQHKQQHHRPHHDHDQTKHHRQHHQQHHTYSANVSTSGSRKTSALAARREQQERQFLESREQTRRWSAQFNASNAQPPPSRQHSRGISI